MSAPLPYHHCNALGCTEMIVPGLTFCPVHAVAFMGDAGHDVFLPEVEKAPPLSPAASQETNHITASVSGDADSEKSTS